MRRLSESMPCTGQRADASQPSSSLLGYSLGMQAAAPASGGGAAGLASAAMQQLNLQALLKAQQQQQQQQQMQQVLQRAGIRPGYHAVGTLPVSLALPQSMPISNELFQGVVHFKSHTRLFTRLQKQLPAQLVECDAVPSAWFIHF